MPSLVWKINGTVLKAIKLSTKGSCHFKSFHVFDGTLNLYFKPCSNGAGQMDVDLLFNIPKQKYVKGSAAFVLSIAEINAIRSQSKTLGQWTIFKNIGKFSDIQYCKSLTLKIEMAMIEAFDENGADVIYLYSEDEDTQESKQSMPKSQGAVKSAIEQLSTRLGEMDNRLRAIELGMTDEKSAESPKLHEIMKEIAFMNQKIDKLSANDTNNVVPGRNRLKAWLEIVVGLGQYYDVFLKNGIEDLSTASLLTMETIKSIGIEKIGHQMKLLNCVIQLKQEQNEGVADNCT